VAQAEGGASPSVRERRLAAPASGEYPAPEMARMPRKTAAREAAPARRTRGGPERILAAAFTCFSRYGYKRVSLEQIAQETGISRAALYLHFRNKEDLFRALARRLLEEAHAAAEAAAASPAPIAERLQAILDAKFGGIFERVWNSPHAAEILDENGKQCGDVLLDFRKRFLRVLRGVLAEAEATGEIDLAAAGLGAGEAAELLVDCVKGLEAAGASPPGFRRRLARLVRVFIAGLGERPAGAAAKPAARARR
jgi:AcrR family transcriptional regulator